MPNEWITQQGEHVSLHGEWTLRHYAELKRALQQQGRLSSAALSLPGFEGLDTAGAALIVELIGVEKTKQIGEWASDLPQVQQALLIRIAEAMDAPLESPTPRPNRISEALATVGQQMVALAIKQKTFSE